MNMKNIFAVLTLAAAAVAQNIAIGSPKANAKLYAGQTSVVSVWKPVRTLFNRLKQRLSILYCLR